jgi:hypothetical protein
MSQHRQIRATSAPYTSHIEGDESIGTHGFTQCTKKYIPGMPHSRLVANYGATGRLLEVLLFLPFFACRIVLKHGIRNDIQEVAQSTEIFGPILAINTLCLQKSTRAFFTRS